MSLTGDDCREGLTAVLSVKVPDPKFSSQTKDKLVSSEVRPVVESLVNELLGEWFEEHPAESKPIVGKVVEAAAAREAARKARELTRRKGALDIASLARQARRLPGARPVEVELFLVEGDSAGGSAKQGRNRENQAVLPLRGKILNVERARFDKMLSSEQIGTLIMALGTVDRQATSSAPDKLRYHKIIIMTDADVDGAHIRTLLLTFFFRQMPELIERGHIFIAQPPLYKVTKRPLRAVSEERAGARGLSDQPGRRRARRCIWKAAKCAPAPICAAIVNEARSGQSSCSTACTAATSAAWSSRRRSPAPSMPALMNDPGARAGGRRARLRRGSMRSPTRSSRAGPARRRPGRRLSVRARAARRARGLDDRRGADRFGRCAQARQPCRRGSAKCSVRPSIFRRRDAETPIHGPRSLLDAVFAAGRKGIQMQRYKGLGEMNASQLWETTLDSNVRSLLQVKVKEADAADDLFAKLMGDDVEPRRDFIQDNALRTSSISTCDGGGSPRWAAPPIFRMTTAPAMGCRGLSGTGGLSNGDPPVRITPGGPFLWGEWVRGSEG